MSEAFVRLFTCRVQTKGMGITARTTSVMIFVTLFTKAMLRYVFTGRHFAVPLPIGGGRRLKFQFADMGMHPIIRVMNVKRMKTMRKTVGGC